MAENVSLLLGTSKGAFILDAVDGKSVWNIQGPFCDGAPINHVIGDAASGMIWAAGGGGWHDIGVWRSHDHGENWTFAELSPGQGQGDLSTLWSLGRTGSALFAGAKPAALYESRDGGARWSKVQGLNDHPSCPDWQPGAAGLVLHSIVADHRHDEKLWVGISAAGVFATEDGGKNWEHRNRRSNVDMQDADGHGTEIGLCVHNIVRAPDGNDLLYQQNHHGVFRSTDGGRNWQAITSGLPSTFGFPIAVHPRDPMTIWVVPLNGDSAGRFPPDASAAVWRSRNGGETWLPMRSGLPQKNCFFTVLRQAMAVDRSTPAGVYFGTNSGSIFASSDEGDTWIEIARHLPTILSVEVLQA
jgi:photosystem II stability/assembly factor-like uncharacterized protein